MLVTRFAPSPTGLLHLGHAYSALLAWDCARRNAGRFLLRIEDIDPTRCRPELAAAMLEDLAWLGIDWDGPVWEQSARMADYAAALATVRGLGVIYPDDRTRREVEAGAHVRPADELAAEADGGKPVAWRLDMRRAMERTGALAWLEEDDVGAVREIAADPSPHGDVILARKDVATSYHLAVTVDDAAQAITHVIRGRDLYDSTPVHRLLQELLGLPAPIYRHHELIADPATGRRYAKSDGSVTLRHLRESGVTPAQIRERVGLAT